MKANVYFVLYSSFLFFIFNSILRSLLYYYNIDLAIGIDKTTILKSFFYGFRFDLLIIGYIFVPIIIGLFVFKGQKYLKFMFVWLCFFFAITSFLGVVELEFYHEFHLRLNSMVFEYLKEDQGTVISMIVNGFPVVKYLLLFAVIMILFVIIIRLIYKKQLQKNKKLSNFRYYTTAVLLLLLFVFFSRGTLRTGPPLRWGDAFNTGHLFTNQLGLNGSYTLLKAATDYNRKAKNNKKWLKSYKYEDARNSTRKLLSDSDYLSDTLPLLRKSTANSSYQGDIKNVVVIIMESFAGMYVGALGHNEEITPNFDEITKDGLLFTNFFSNGTHTHQGMFATIASFPNVPGYEYLMQKEEGTNLFSGLPELLKGKIDNNAYVYNGDFSWDNQQGFFSIQGMTSFVGRNDYINPTFIDKTWGVSDFDMFNRALLELDKLDDKKEPFYAVLQTLSNHVPFKLPDPLPVKKVFENGKFSERLTAMRYADWALGEFYKELKTKKYYKNTAFLFLGDHGFSMNKQLTDMDLSRFHIPLLIVAPKIKESFGDKSDKVGSQVDVVPTIMGLFKNDYINQSWGRDLLSLPNDDLGFAIIKPSGSSSTVAIIEGATIDDKNTNKIAVFPENVEPSLWQFDLKTIKDKKINDEQEIKELRVKVYSYIQLAIRTLLDGNVGVKEKKGTANKK